MGLLTFDFSEEKKEQLLVVHRDGYRQGNQQRAGQSNNQALSATLRTHTTIAFGIYLFYAVIPEIFCNFAIYHQRITLNLS